MVGFVKLFFLKSKLFWVEAFSLLSRAGMVKLCFLNFGIDLDLDLDLLLLDFLSTFWNLGIWGFN